MPRPLFAALFVGLLASSTRADDPKLPGPKFALPEVAGLNRQKANLFKEAGLGYSVSYFGKDTSLTVTVYVYNLGRDKVPTGAGSDAVKAEMLDSLNALEANKTNGRYKAIAPAGETTVSPAGKGGPEFRRRRYEIDIAKEGEGTTELYLTGYKDHFVKIRTTYLDKDRAECEKQVAKLLEALAAELK
jgi:hypothetical protein